MYELTEVRKSFRKGGATVQALDGVNLTIDTGEFLAVQGPTGQGKSTLLLRARARGVSPPNRSKPSPIMPPGATPGLVIAPVAGSKRVPTVGPHPLPPPCSGSQLGTMKGFTQRGMIGTAVVPVIVAEFEGLKPSAVAAARTVSAARLQIREKNVGRFVFCTVTVTLSVQGARLKYGSRLELTSSWSSTCALPSKLNEYR